MYFLIGIWGGPRREYAAIKFFLYTLAGSVLMLLALLALYFYADAAHLRHDQAGCAGRTTRSRSTSRSSLWVALFIGFAIKIPTFPFHTWLPDAHVEAPTAISVILAGVLLKMGTYGILRINFGILPAATAELAFYFLGALGTINIVYGALCAMAQTDLKKLVAYSLGQPHGLRPARHGGVHAAGHQRRRAADVQPRHHHRDALPPRRRDLRPRPPPRDRRLRRPRVGHAASTPASPALAFFASLGLPGLSAFISEVLVLLGAWQPYPGAHRRSAPSAVILTAGYILWTHAAHVPRQGEREVPRASPRSTARELFTLVPLAVIVLVLGFYPQADPRPA